MGFKMQQKNRWYGKGIITAFKTLKVLEKETKEVEERIFIIDLYDRCGLEYVKKRFKVGRSTIYLWKKKLKEEGIIGLKNKSRAPINKRKSKIKEEVKEYIRQYRTKHIGVSKEVIYPQLRQYCKEKGLKEISESSIGRIIKELKEEGKILSKKELHMNGKTGRITEIRRKNKKKNRYKRKEIKGLGEIVQIDSIHLRYGKIKLYVITGIDRVSRYVYAKVYKVLNSDITTEFMREMKDKFPFNIRAVQTDNGLEFEKHFDKYTQDNKIIHYFNYPRNPKSNAYIERFNRTIQEQFFNHIEDIEDINEINKQLTQYLHWYNFTKVHKGLNYITPIEFINKNLIN